MTGKGLRLKVEMEVHAVSCPGVFLHIKSPVHLSICFLGFHVKTKPFPPSFPLLFHDRFSFEKTFLHCSNLDQLQRALEADLVYVELLQEQGSCGNTVLATFETSAAELLFPYPAVRGPCCTGVDVDLLMEPTSDFPGIIAPKIEAATSTNIEETRRPELDQCKDGAAVLQNSPPPIHKHPHLNKRPESVMRQEMEDRDPFAWRKFDEDLINRNPMIHTMYNPAGISRSEGGLERACSESSLDIRPVRMSRTRSTSRDRHKHFRSKSCSGLHTADQQQDHPDHNQRTTTTCPDPQVCQSSPDHHHPRPYSAPDPVHARHHQHHQGADERSESPHHHHGGGDGGYGRYGRSPQRHPLGPGRCGSPHPGGPGRPVSPVQRHNHGTGDHGRGASPPHGRPHAADEGPGRFPSPLRRPMPPRELSCSRESGFVDVHPHHEDRCGGPGPGGPPHPAGPHHQPPPLEPVNSHLACCRACAGDCTGECSCHQAHHNCCRACAGSCNGECSCHQSNCCQSCHTNCNGQCTCHQSSCCSRCFLNCTGFCSCHGINCCYSCAAHCNGSCQCHMSGCCMKCRHSCNGFCSCHGVNCCNRCSINCNGSCSCHNSSCCGRCFRNCNGSCTCHSVNCCSHCNKYDCNGTCIRHNTHSKHHYNACCNNCNIPCFGNCICHSKCCNRCIHNCRGDCRCHRVEEHSRPRHAPVKPISHHASSPRHADATFLHHGDVHCSNCHLDCHAGAHSFCGHPNKHCYCSCKADHHQRHGHCKEQPGNFHNHWKQCHPNHGQSLDCCKRNCPSPAHCPWSCDLPKPWPPGPHLHSKPSLFNR